MNLTPVLFYGHSVATSQPVVEFLKGQFAVDEGNRAELISYSPAQIGLMLDQVGKNIGRHFAAAYAGTPQAKYDDRTHLLIGRCIAADVALALMCRGWTCTKETEILMRRARELARGQTEWLWSSDAYEEFHAQLYGLLGVMGAMRRGIDTPIRPLALMLAACALAADTHENLYLTVRYYLERVTGLQGATLGDVADACYFGGTAPGVMHLDKLAPDIFKLLAPFRQQQG